jgi:ABC-type nitrate/sulfonate/bicarbonate transport system ATPase subunit
MDEPLGALDALTRLELQDTIRRIWLETGATTVLVTHDVDEAIYLSNRIIILSPRPGHITAILDVNLPSLAASSPSPDSPFPPPPDRDHPAFIALRRQILQALH